MFLRVTATKIYIIIYIARKKMADFKHPQGHYNGPRKWEQNGGRKPTLNYIPRLRSEGMIMDRFCHSYQYF